MFQKTNFGQVKKNIGKFHVLVKKKVSLSFIMSFKYITNDNTKLSETNSFSFYE